MYYLLGTALALAAFFVVNLIASFTATACWLCVRRQSLRWSALRRAQILFAFRFAPSLIAFIVTATIFIPAYVIYEPRATGEPVSLKLGFIALLSLCGILFAAWRVAASWRMTRRLTSLWMREASPVALADNSIPAYRIPHEFPLIAVVGCFKPKLFLADQVFETLDENQIAAAVAHETAHVAARDNLKRTLLNFSRDLLLTVPCSRTLEREWRIESEAAADECAARGRAAALTLASVLIKIARLAPAKAKPFMPAGSYIADDSACVARRVQLLTQFATRKPADSRPPAAPASRLLRAVIIANLCIILFETIRPESLATAHALLEFFVKL